MDNFYFGTHINNTNYIESHIKNIKKIGGNLIQIFLTIPGITETEKKTDEELLKIKNILLKHNFKIVIHSSYTHNLAKNWDKYSWWLHNIELEIEYAHKLGAIGVVIHFGKYIDLSIQEAYNNMYSSLVYLHNKTIQYKDVKIILETSTGQGSELCFKIEDLAYFFKKFTRSSNEELKNRMRICIDTCHIFSAGYNLKTKNAVKLYIESFEELIGLHYISLIHLNDCKVDVGCQRDRHQNIGKGFIGLDGLKYFFNYFRKLKIPIILETPDDGYKTEIPILLNS